MQVKSNLVLSSLGCPVSPANQSTGQMADVTLYNDAVFMPFIMDIMGRLGPSAVEIIRIASNGVSGSDDDRRIVVAVRKEHLGIIINRHRQRSPSFSRVLELASNSFWDDSVYPGGMLAGYVGSSHDKSKEISHLSSVPSGPL